VTLRFVRDAAVHPTPNSYSRDKTMRVYIAGVLTALVFVLGYFFVAKMKHQLDGFGTEMPKYIEVAIALADTAVNYFYVFLPLLFFFFKFVVGIVMTDKPEMED